MFAVTSTPACVRATQGTALAGGVRCRRIFKSSLSAPVVRRERGAASLRVNAEFSIGKLTSVLAKKTKGDLERVFKGTSKTREKLSYLDEVLALWNLDGLEDTLEELEDTLLSVDFGPTTAMNILDVVRERCEKGEIKTGAEVKVALKRDHRGHPRPRQRRQGGNRSPHAERGRRALGHHGRGRQRRRKDHDGR